MKLKLVKPLPKSNVEKVIEFLTKPRFINFSKNSIEWGEGNSNDFYKKVEFLYQDAFDHFLTVRTTAHTKRIKGKVDFPPEYYAFIDAEKLARLNIARVVREGKVDQLYKKLSQRVTA